MMVVGLYSGKEIIVQDKSYFVNIGDTIKQVFISPEGKRRYTITESRIEYYDEVHSSDYMNKLYTSIETTKENLESVKGDSAYV